jgi:ubiquinone/menaquinone biosynthesis C-methylase UbiE
MIDTYLGSYEDIASEYYDPIRHPTCANFREGSAILLNKWLREINPKTGWFCEVGAGKSLVAELLTAKEHRQAHLIVADASPSMLAFSKKWANTITHLVIADSTMLAITSESLDLLISSLGDPYNVPSFWSEAYRTLRPGGTAVFTTPSFDWAMAFREKYKSELTSAEFETIGGEVVSVPSWIYSQVEQIEMIEKSGLLVNEHARVSIPQITSTSLSPKLLRGRGFDAEVVEGYLITKSQ